MPLRRTFFALGLGMAVLLASTVPTQAISFTGSLSTEIDVAIDGDLAVDAAGLQGPAGTQWAAGPTVLDWTISQDSPGDPWHYVYTLEVSEKGISHFQFEVSDFIEEGDFEEEGIPSEPSATPAAGEVELGTFTPDPPGSGDSPSMPGDVYALKFGDPDESGGDVLTFEADFWLFVGPVWGDFYGKGGAVGMGDTTKNAIWNAGFAVGETSGAGNDPVAPPADGQLLGHLLVPDSTNGPPPPPPPPIPEPMTAGGLLLGVGALVGYLRRRRR